MARDVLIESIMQTRRTAALLLKILRSLVAEGFAGTIVADHVQVYVCAGCASRHPALGTSQAWHLRTLEDREAFLAACEAHMCQVVAAVAVPTKALKAGVLAISAELIGSECEALQAARTCGRIAASAGCTLDTLWAALLTHNVGKTGMVWGAVVDAHMDARG